MNNLLSTSDVAEILHIPERTLDNWSWKGIGPRFARVGRYRRYDPDDLRRWLESQKAGSPDAA